MAGKKISKDMDLAAGFFSQPAPEETTTEESVTVVEETPSGKVEAVEEKKATPKSSEKEKPPKEEKKEPSKNLGGRPKKEGLKNEQFTLTMNPETYEKLKIVADEYTRGNFSGLIDEAIKAFCREKEINLAEIEVDKDIIKFYKEKQEKKSKKK